MKQTMWRGAAALLMLAALAIVAQDALLRALIGPWRTAIELLDSDFHVVDLRVAAGIDPTIELAVTPARILIVGSRVVMADAGALANSSTPRGAVWLLLSIYLATLVAWPTARPTREWPLRLALGAPLLIALLLLDVPITLLGPLREVLVEHMNPGGWDAWVSASSFLRGGGRCLIAAAGAASVCLAACALTRPRT